MFSIRDSVHCFAAYLEGLQGVVDTLDSLLNGLRILFILEYLLPYRPHTKLSEPLSLSVENPAQNEI